MRAGLLRHFVTVYRQVDEQSASGAVSQVRKKIITLRCHLVKQSGYLKQTTFEEVDTNSLVFETWLNNLVKDTDTLEYADQEFKITLIETDLFTKTMKLHCSKINK